MPVANAIPAVSPATKTVTPVVPPVAPPVVAPVPTGTRRVRQADGHGGWKVVYK